MPLLSILRASVFCNSANSLSSASGVRLPTGSIFSAFSKKVRHLGRMPSALRKAS